MYTCVHVCVCVLCVCTYMCCVCARTCVVCVHVHVLCVCTYMCCVCAHTYVCTGIRAHICVQRQCSHEPQQNAHVLHAHSGIWLHTDMTREMAGKQREQPLTYCTHGAWKEVDWVWDELVFMQSHSRYDRADNSLSWGSLGVRHSGCCSR